MKYPLLAYVDDNGKVEWSNQREAVAAFGRFKGKDVLILIEEKQELKTYLQVKYLWGLVFPLMKAGFADQGKWFRSNDDCYRFLVGEFSHEAIVDERSGEILGYYCETLSGMTIKRTIEFIEWLLQYAAENLHIVVPEPDKNWKEKKA